MTVTPKLLVRDATPDDVPFVLAMIKELAAYEREPDAVRSTEASLREHLFGDHATRGLRVEAIVGEVDSVPQGAAIFFQNFSTWSGGTGLYLEDLYVRPEARRLGLGRSMLLHLARLAHRRGCRRFEWAVLDWNTPAQDFYAALGAREMTGWHIWRLGPEALAALAQRPDRA